MELVGYSEAAAILGVARGTVYAWVSQKRVPHIRLSARLVRFDTEELKAWILERKVKTQALER